MGSGSEAARATGGGAASTEPYLGYVEDGERRRFVLSDRADRLTVGRGDGVDLQLDFDPTVSQLHAELERLGRHWVVSDDGLSRHGSYLNGERTSGRHRLRDGDELRVGETTLTFVQRATTVGEGPAPTAAAPARKGPDRLSDRQREVMVALARPFGGESAYPVPATNRQIAEETHLSVDAVKRHLRILFERFGIGALPQNEKRVRLVELALENGLITRRELSAPER